MPHVRIRSLALGVSALSIVLLFVPGVVNAQGRLIDAIVPSSGTPGGRVTIMGAGFGAHNVRISIAGIAATIVSASGHQVTFIVPSDVPPGPAMVVAENPGGRSGSIAFTVLSPGGGNGGGGYVAGPPQILAQDTARASSATIGEDGGVITATGASGTIYSLIVPAGALLADAVFTLTPITAVSPLSGVPIAVRLQPSGFQLLRPARLEITPATPGQPTERTLGFIFNDDGTAFEVLPVEFNGQTMAIEIAHFSAAGTAGASAADFAATMQPLLDALPSSLPPGQVASLVSTLVSWLEPSTPGGLPHFELCSTTTLCQQVFQIAMQSLVSNRDQACSQVSTLIQNGEPFLARVALAQVVSIGARLVEIGTLAAEAGVGGFEQTFDLTCVADSLMSIVQLAREQVLVNPRPGLLGLIAEVAGDAALLGLDSEKSQALSVLADVIGLLVDRANERCLSDPISGEFIIRPVLVGFSADFLNGLDFGLDARVEQAFAECRVRISPDAPTVGIGQTQQFIGSAIGLIPTDVTWSVSGGGTIDPQNGLFTAGQTTGTFTVTATSTAEREALPPPRGIVPERRKSTSVTVVNIAVTVNPASVTLSTGASRQFAVIVSGLSNLDVVWTATGGTIDPATGFFTAPTTAGTVRVRATSVETPAFGEAVVTVIAPTGRITAFNHVTWIGACASADAQVLTSGFANPAMTLSIQGPGAFLNQTLINTTTFMTVRANNNSSGEIIVTATSVESPSVSARATFLIDPFVAAYGGGSSGSAFLVRGVDAGLPDDNYRLGLNLSPSTSGIFTISGSGSIQTGTATNGNSVTVTLGSNAMQGTVTTPTGAAQNFELGRNCAPLPR